jgi:predicted PurR-regulated permease PerM
MPSKNGPTSSDRDPDAPAVPSPKVDGPLTSGRPLRPVALAIVTLVLIALCVYLAIPFLPALTWALALAILAWPLHVWIIRHIHRPTLAAVLTTLAVVVLVLVPFLFVSYQLAQEATSAAERMKEDSAKNVLRDAMEKTPGLRRVVEWADRANVDIDRAVRQVVASYTQDSTALIQGSFGAILQFVVAIFILYHLFHDRAAMLQGARSLLPLTKDESDQVFKRVTEAVNANLYAIVMTSLISAIGGGIMFWALGLPSPVLWGVVMFILSLLPILGIFIVWVPAAAYLALSGQWPQALALVTWGIANMIVVDNFIYVRLAGSRMHLHQVAALLAILGGIWYFGPSGIILGPTILAVTVALLEVWHRRAVVIPALPAATPLVAVTVPDGGPDPRPEEADVAEKSEVTV